MVSVRNPSPNSVQSPQEAARTGSEATPGARAGEASQGFGNRYEPTVRREAPDARGTVEQRPDIPAPTAVRSAAAGARASARATAANLTAPPRREVSVGAVTSSVNAPAHGYVPAMRAALLQEVERITAQAPYPVVITARLSSLETTPTQDGVQVRASVSLIIQDAQGNMRAMLNANAATEERGRGGQARDATQEAVAVHAMRAAANQIAAALQGLPPR